MRWSDAAARCIEAAVDRPDLHRSTVCARCARELLRGMLRDLMERVLSVDGLEVGILQRRKVARAVDAFAREAGLVD